MSWRMARALEVLRLEINQAAPERARASDGGIGDRAHRGRISDHNPCDCCAVVCARDFTHDPAGGFDAERFAAWLQRRLEADRERRVRYVIWDRRICSGPAQGHPVGLWRRYEGANPHTTHVHISVRHPRRYFDDEGAWGWPP